MTEAYEWHCGTKAIAAAIGKGAMETSCLMRSGALPCELIGGIRCIRRSTLSAWLKSQEGR